MLRWCLLSSNHPLILSHSQRLCMCVCTLHMVGHRAGENDVAKTWLLFSHHGPHHPCLTHGTVLFHRSPQIQNQIIRLCCLPTNFCGVELLRFPIFAVSFSMTAGLSKGTREILLSIIGSCSLQSSMGGTT